MLYLINHGDSLIQAIESPHKNCVEDYRLYMQALALGKYNLVINPHWLNAMIMEFSPLIPEDSKNWTKKQWKKELIEKSFSWYLLNHKDGKALETEIFYQ